MMSANSDGSSLVEMLMAMAVAAIALAVVAGNPFAQKRLNNVTQIARDIAVAITELEAKAVSNATAFPILVDVKNREITIDKKVFELPEQLSLSIKTGAELISQDERGAIWLFPNGTSSGGEIALGDPSGKVQAVRINWVTGAIKIIGVAS